MKWPPPRSTLPDPRGETMFALRGVDANQDGGLHQREHAEPTRIAFDKIDGNHDAFRDAAELLAADTSSPGYPVVGNWQLRAPWLPVAPMQLAPASPPSTCLQLANAMTHPDDEYDPDDNFANSNDDGMDVDDEAAAEALVWQLLQMINPGDEEAALQQFGTWREMVADADTDTDPDEADPMASLRQAIDWKSGFHVGARDMIGLIESLEELSTRFDARIDWGVEDLDGDALDDTDVPSLIVRAHAQLREHGYTLWTWNPRGEASEEVYSGWIALRRDEEAMLALAAALGIEVRLGNAH